MSFCFFSDVDWRSLALRFCFASGFVKKFTKSLIVFFGRGYNRQIHIRDYTENGRQRPESDIHSKVFELRVDSSFSDCMTPAIAMAVCAASAPRL